MTTNQERAIEAIEDEHDPHFGPIDAPSLVYALSGAGLLMEDLPEPAYEGSTTWYVPGEHEWATDAYKGEVMLEVDIEEAGNFGPSTVSKTWFMQRDEARALALAILAAANHTEQERDHG